ncbi:MAG: flagellar biosynthesis anti-sigma factor FlgM [Nitrospiraceae bacterium]
MEISRHGRIDDLGRLLLGVQEADRPTADKTLKAVPSGADRVEISHAAKEMRQVGELTRAADPARDQRLAELKQAVDTGTYDVRGRAVGDRLIRHTLIDSIL